MRRAVEKKELSGDPREATSHFFLAVFLAPTLGPVLVFLAGVLVFFAGISRHLRFFRTKMRVSCIIRI
jgi:hypothetical protein